MRSDALHRSRSRSYAEAVTDRDGIRLLRSAASSIDTAAAVAGRSLAGFRRVVRGLQARGECAQTVAVIARRSRDRGQRLWALVHRACPPSTVRAAPSADWARPRGAQRRQAAVTAACSPDVSTREKGTQAAAPAMLCRLSEDPDWHVRLRVAANPAAPAEAIRRLSEDPDQSVRYGVTGNPAAPPEVLERFRDISTDRVQDRLAANPSTPVEVLEQLLSSPLQDVCARVAANPSTPARVLQELSKHPNAYLRERVAHNPSASAQALQQLSKDPEPRVRSRATAALSNKR